MAGEELVHRMASKWEKVAMVDKAASGALGHKLMICGIEQLNGGMRNFIS